MAVDALLLDDPGNPGHQGFATLRGKDFYAQDTDPGAVGAGSVWRDTGATPPVWWTRNDANDGWDSIAAIAATATGDDTAETSLNAYAPGDGNATATVRASADGAGVADARTTVYSVGGAAWAGPNVTSFGAAGANASSTANTEGAGAAIASLNATAIGSGNADVTAQATTAAGIAEAGSMATRDGVTTGMYAAVADGAALLGFNAVAANGGIAIPELPATPTEQDIADVLVALGLVTQAP